MEDDLNKTKIKWKTNQSTKINLLGCETIVNSPTYKFKKSKLFLVCSKWEKLHYYQIMIKYISNYRSENQVG